jgi:PPP family 3-phenylpropionic acid transporter
MITAKKNEYHLRLLYTLLFIAIGSSQPFASIFLKRVLVSPAGKPAIELIGIIYAILPFIGMIAGISAGIIADRFRLGPRVIALCCFTGACAAILLGQASEPWTLQWTIKAKFIFVLLVSLAYGFGTGPIVGLVDAETLHFLNARKSREKYGTFRLWGTFGWLVSTIAMGILLTTGKRIGMMYYGTSAGLFLLGFASLGIPSSSSEKPEKIPFGHLWQNRGFQVFLCFIFFYGMIYNMTFSYLGYFFDDVMRSFWQMGLIFGAWTIFEIPVMMYSNRLITRFGSKALIMTGMSINAVRLILFGMFTLQTPYAVKFLVALLQGPGYAFTQIGFIDFIDRKAHGSMRATYLNSASVVQNTLGASAGGLIGSVLIKNLGSAGMFGLSGIALAGLVIFFLAGIKKQKNSNPTF